MLVGMHMPTAVAYGRHGKRCIARTQPYCCIDINNDIRYVNDRTQDRPRQCHTHATERSAVWTAAAAVASAAAAAAVTYPKNDRSTLGVSIHPTLMSRTNKMNTRRQPTTHRRLPGITPFVAHIDRRCQVQMPKKLSFGLSRTSGNSFISNIGLFIRCCFDIRLLYTRGN